jgi:hypothetical protein
VDRSRSVFKFNDHGFIDEFFLTPMRAPKEYLTKSNERQLSWCPTVNVVKRLPNKTPTRNRGLSLEVKFIGFGSHFFYQYWSP